MAYGMDFYYKSMKIDIMLIGSKAAKYHFSDFPREPADVDYISKEEVEKTDSKYCPSFELILKKYRAEIAPPEVLYTLKVSHAAWDIFWEKTMFDVRFFQSKGIRLDEELYPALYADCEKRHGKKKAYLSKSNEEFFNDNVRRVYVHDSIHAAVAFHDRPLYFDIKIDESKAQTCKALFWALTPPDRIKLCKEEIFVTALERFLIPADFQMHFQTAYWRAYKKLVVDMTGGYFCKFLIENCLELNKKPYFNFVKKFRANREKLVKIS